MINLKTYILIITLIFILSISSYYSLNIIVDTSTLLENNVINIEKSIRDKKWLKAEEIIEKTNLEWTKHEKVWSVLLEHIEIDAIEFSLIKLETHIKQKNYSLSLSESIIIQAHLKHIRENDSLKLINLL